MRFIYAAVAVLALVAVAEASPATIAHRKLIETARARFEDVRGLVDNHRDRVRALAEGDPDGSFDFDFDFDGGSSGGGSSGELPGCFRYAFTNQTAYQDCQDECLQNADGYSTFASDACLAGRLNASDELDFDNLFPDLDNIENRTQGNAQYEQFCTCGKTLFRFVNFYLTNVLSCVFGQRIEGVGAQLGQFDQAMDALAGYMCIKNGEDYCLVTMALQEDFSEVEDADADGFTIGNLTREQQCDFFEDMGCCGPSMVRALRNPALTQLFTEDDSDSDDSFGGGDDDDDDDKETEREFLDNIAQFETAMNACGFGAVRPCLTPGQSDTFAKATITLDANFTVIASSEEKMRAFKKAFREDMAAALNVPVPEIIINSVRQGSVIVDFNVRGADKKDKLDAAIATGVPLTNVKSSVPEYSAVADVSTSNAQTDAVVVENDSDVSPASGAVPSLVALVLLAVLALFQ